MNDPSQNLVAEFAADVGEHGFADQILAIIGDAPALPADERRSRDRFPIYCCMQLTPLDAMREPIHGATTTVVGKDLSTNGICFSHEHKLLHNRVIVTLPHSDLETLCVEAEIAWTRQTPIGLYESGCRLIRKITDER